MLREGARIGDGADARRVIEGDAPIGRDRTAPSELLSRFPRMDVMPDWRAHGDARCVARAARAANGWTTRL